MAVPEYNELLARMGVDGSLMEQTFNNSLLKELALKLDRWEILAKYLEIPNPEIENIKSQAPGDVAIQRIKLLERWKERCGSAATYKEIVRALLQINRTDLAEEVISLVLSLREAHSPPSSNECIKVVFTFTESSHPDVIIHLSKRFLESCENNDVVRIQVDGNNTYSSVDNSMVCNLNSEPQTQLTCMHCI